MKDVGSLAVSAYKCCINLPLLFASILDAPPASMDELAGLDENKQV